MIPKCIPFIFNRGPLDMSKMVNSPITYVAMCHGGPFWATGATESLVSRWREHSSLIIADGDQCSPPWEDKTCGLVYYWRPGCPHGQPATQALEAASRDRTFQHLCRKLRKDMQNSYAFSQIDWRFLEIKEECLQRFFFKSVDLLMWSRDIPAQCDYCSDSRTGNELLCLMFQALFIL